MLHAKSVFLSLAFFLVLLVGVHRFFQTIHLGPAEKVISPLYSVTKYLIYVFNDCFSTHHFHIISVMTDICPCLGRSWPLQARETFSLHSSCQNHCCEILGQCCIPITVYYQTKCVQFLIKLLGIMPTSRLCVTAYLHILCIFLGAIVSNLLLPSLSYFPMTGTHLIPSVSQCLY